MAPRAGPTGVASESVSRLGFWAAVLTAAFYTAWDLGFVAGFFLQWPATLTAAWAPSVFIPPAWVLLMVCVDRWAPEERRVFGEAAVAFGAIYAALSTAVYFVQLTVAIPTELAGAGAQQVGVLLWDQPRSFPYALDILGYTFMSLSALFAAFAFARQRFERWVRWTLLASGVVAVVLPIQMFWLPAEVAAAPTLFTFPAAAILLAVHFRRAGRGLSP
jgi:hypothetical protein